MPAVLRVERGGVLERVGLFPKIVARLRTARRGRPRRGRSVALRLAGHRALTANVECAHSVDLAGVVDADDHAVLLVDGRIRDRGFQTPEVDGRARVLVEPRQHRSDRRGRRRKRRGRSARNGTGSRRDGRAVTRDELSARSVVGPCALDIRLHDPVAGRLSPLDGAVHVHDRRFFDVKNPGGRPPPSRRRRAWLPFDSLTRTRSPCE